MRYVRNPLTGEVCCVSREEAKRRIFYGWSYANAEAFKAWQVRSIMLKHWRVNYEMHGVEYTMHATKGYR